LGWEGKNERKLKVSEFIEGFTEVSIYKYYPEIKRIECFVSFIQRNGN